MKKFFVFVSLVAIAALPVFADMDSKEYSLRVIGATTNSSSIVIRGELEAIKVDLTAGQTNTVRVTSGELTLFEKATIGADATYLPRAATHTTAGVAATFVGGTNDTANVWYSKQPMAGTITVRVIGESAGTNTVVTTLIYNK